MEQIVGKYYEVIYNGNVYEYRTQKEAADALGITLTYFNWIYKGRATIDGLTVTKKYRIINVRKEKQQ